MTAFLIYIVIVFGIATISLAHDLLRPLQAFESRTTQLSGLIVGEVTLVWAAFLLGERFA